LAEAIGYAAQGVLPPKDPTEIDLPLELVEALDVDPALAEAFRALTPGRRKSWALHIADAKVPSTRIGRIAKGRPQIMAGKGATER
jgi:uncharacterized protein YdeI (YjbR/CyaY-like superfamily)